jgi:hypothetical protein
MNGKRVVKANVGKVAAITVDLIKRGVAVYRVGDVYPADVLQPGEEAMWFVSAPNDSPLADKAATILPATSEDEAWELAIEFLATNHEISEDLRAGVTTHRRTLRKVWRVMRDHGAYAVHCESYASEHYGDPFPTWGRIACWLDGAATGFFNDDCRMPFMWRLMGKTPAEWRLS